jgi:hypothetical protein
MFSLARLKMKKWGLRILSAFLTFTLGLCATTIIRFRPAPAPISQPAHTDADLEEQLPPTQVSEQRPLRDEIMRPHAVEISPYEIKRLIDENKRTAARRSELDVKPIWEQLNIQDDGKSSFTMDQCNGYCSADIFTHELDGKPGKETVLRLSAAATWGYRYLIFKQDNSQRGADSVWILLGYVDAFVRYSNPRHRVMTAGRQRWLAIEYVSGYGSGFGSGAENWYEVTADGVKKVLSYQTYLYQGLHHPEIDRQATVTKVEQRDGIAIVSIRTSTSYGGLLEDLNERFPLWTARRQGTFIKGPGMREFIFDALHSEIASEEVDPYYGGDGGISAEELLKYNYRELARLAGKGTYEQGLWLRRYLDTCDDSVEKQSLRKILADAALSDKCPY